MSSKKLITVSIVSHGQLELVLPLLEQLNQHSSPIIAKVVLTLNIPEPYLLATQKWTYPIVVLENSKVKGFGANHNQAFRQCETPWFLIMNPDVRLNRDVLTPLVSLAEADSGILTPRIQEPSKTEPEQHRKIITPLEILTRRRAGYKRPTVPEWIPGLFMLFRSAAYSQIGGFDENRYFMYGEDFDICARTRLAGWMLQVGEDLLVIHDARRSSHGSGMHLNWHMTSLLKVWSSRAFWRYRSLDRSQKHAVGTHTSTRLK